jgi:hypothetical protein
MLQSECLDGTDYCLPAFVRSIKGGFPPAEDTNVGTTLPLFALHAALLIPRLPNRSAVGRISEIASTRVAGSASGDQRELSQLLSASEDV